MQTNGHNHGPINGHNGLRYINGLKDPYSLPEPPEAAPQKTSSLGAVFDFQDLPVRVLGTPDEPLFVAVDVCRVLEIANSRDAVASLDPEDVRSISRATVAQTDGDTRTMNLVTESGLYALVFRSNKPNAKAFQRWVTREVLPSLRKTGGYQIPQPPAGASTMSAEPECFKYMDALTQRGFDKRDAYHLSRPEARAELLPHCQVESRAVLALNLGLTESYVRKVEAGYATSARVSAALEEWKKRYPHERSRRRTGNSGSFKSNNVHVQAQPGSDLSLARELGYSRTHIRRVRLGKERNVRIEEALMKYGKLPAPRN